MNLCIAISHLLKYFSLIFKKHKSSRYLIYYDLMSIEELMAFKKYKKFKPFPAGRMVIDKVLVTYLLELKPKNY